MPTPAEIEATAKAAYRELTGTSLEITDEHFQWYDEGKDNPQSCVHYSNVGKAYRIAQAAIPEREREIERLRAEHGAMMECVIKVKARVAELEAALRRILEAAVANLPDQPPVTRKAKTHIDEGDHAHPRRD